jgi:glycerate-2-kinase
MQHTRLRQQAEDIWAAGVRAVDSERLVSHVVQRHGGVLEICGHELRLDEIGRIVVVGAGKAGAGMAAGFEQAVGEDVLESKVTGWVNVPADCVRTLGRIHLCAARPAGVNEPTAEGVSGSLEILRLVSQLEAHDVCIVLLSGGGSALLPAPVDGVSLADKQAVTRLLMQSGASIGELNCVRKQLSRIKGGGLARAAVGRIGNPSCSSRAPRVITLIISDVIGDPLDVIASGPTVDDSSTPDDALVVLAKYGRQPGDVPETVLTFLRDAAAHGEPRQPLPPAVSNHIIGNNAVALAAAAARARQLGCEVQSLGSDHAGEARMVGGELAELCLRLRESRPMGAPPVCVLSGGEPVVHLVPTDQSRRGGRNQEVALAALVRLWEDGLVDLAILSGGTDGEDGPTDAAGAVADAAVCQQARECGLDPTAFLAINNAYPFFDQTGGLLRTGPTHTNVMDLRVALVGG